MLNKLEGIYQRYLEVSNMMTDTEIMSDQEKMTKLYKENAELSPIVDKYLEYKKCEESKEEAELMLADNDDEEFKAMLEEIPEDMLPEETESETNGSLDFGGSNKDDSAWTD